MEKTNPQISCKILKKKKLRNCCKRSRKEKFNETAIENIEKEKENNILPA